MIRVKSLSEEFTEAACQVIERSELPTLAELALRLSLIEAQRREVMGLIDYRASEDAKFISDDQYQMLMDFVLLQAGRKQIDSDKLMSDLCFEYMVVDLQELKISNLWDAMTFIRSY